MLEIYLDSPFFSTLQELGGRLPESGRHRPIAIGRGADETRHTESNPFNIIKGAVRGLSDQLDLSKGGAVYLTSPRVTSVPRGWNDR